MPLTWEAPPDNHNGNQTPCLLKFFLWPCFIIFLWALIFYLLDILFIWYLSLSLLEYKPFTNEILPGLLTDVSHGFRIVSGTQ